MICSQCQSENSFNAIFCDHCGVRLETACPKCGEPNRQGAKFCRNCGQSINHTAAAAAPPAVPGVPSPETYVPKYLAEKILASRHNLEGERKQVTVLFADIRGSTQLIEGRDPEEAQKLIDPVLRVMMDAVHRYEGTVNQVLGDGIMALFGAPLAHEDHALRACYAALAMQEEMRRYRQNLGQSEELGLQIGIGLNSGEVVVRSISNDLNVDYSALGQTTHLAARMQELTGAGGMLITSATLREVEGFVEVKSLGALQIKGISRPVHAYELLAATSVRTRLHAAASRGLTPFVGRNAEIETFQKLIEKSAAGRGQIFSLVGEPGMGKSRLVYEFIHSHVPPDWLILEAPSVSFGKATPYFPLIELLRRYFAVLDGEEIESIRTKVVDSVLNLDGMLKDAIPPILALLGALPDPATGPIDELGWSGQWQGLVEAIKRLNDMEPRQRRRHTFDALKRLMIRESQKQQLMLVFEDLHWIDGETQAFLDALVESLPMAHILLLVNYRPGYSHSWADKTYYTQLRVDPLQPEGAQELLDHLLGNNEDLGPLKELLIERTDGNPFFAEETVRSLLETGFLIGTKGAYRPGLKIDTISIPSRVQTVLADRIDRLPIEHKHLLQTAAVIGMIVPLPLLRSVAELPEDDLHRYVSHLQTAEFLYEKNLFPEVEYSFKHALTTEVAYGALLHERRTFLHARTVKALEEMAENLSHDHLEKLAHHAFYGELWDKAVSYQGQAGTKALECSANREAVTFFEKALDALKHVPHDRKMLEKAVDLRLELRTAFFLLGEFEKIRDCLSEAQKLAENLKDLSRLRRVWNLQLSYFSLAGEPQRVLELGQKALASDFVCEEPSLDLVTNYYMAINHHVIGNYEQAVQILKPVIRKLDEGDAKFERFGTSTVLSVSCRYWLVQSLAQTGWFCEGSSAAREGIETARQAMHPYSRAYAETSLGFLLLVKGDLKPAIEALQHAMNICRDADIRSLFPQIASYLGYVYALSGYVSESLKLLEEADSESVAIGRIAGRSLRLTLYAEAYLNFGRLEDASKLAARALDLSRKHCEKGHSAWTLKLMGEILAGDDQPDFEQAEVRYNEALSVATELGMRPLQGHCHLALSQLHLRNAKKAIACNELSNAIEIYRRLDMPFWLAQAAVVSNNLQ